jgi:hypothetical protein
MSGAVRHSREVADSSVAVGEVVAHVVRTGKIGEDGASMPASRAMG